MCHKSQRKHANKAKSITQYTHTQKHKNTKTQKHNNNNNNNIISQKHELQTADSQNCKKIYIYIYIDM